MHLPGVNSLMERLGYKIKAWATFYVDLSCSSEEVLSKIEHSARKGIKKATRQKESLTFLMLMYKDFTVHIQSSWISPLKERKIIVAGTKKMVVFDDMKPCTEKLTIYDKGVDVIAGEDIEYQDYAVKNRVGDMWIPFLEEKMHFTKA